MKTAPCQPRVLHEILRNTIQGAKLAYMSKYKNTKTTRVMYGKSSNIIGMRTQKTRIQARCISEWLRLYALANQISPTRPILIECPTVLANTIRVLSWSKITGGLPIEGVTIPHPAHQFSLKYLDKKLQKMTKD
jgi:hypothetical protein